MGLWELMTTFQSLVGEELNCRLSTRYGASRTLVELHAVFLEAPYTNVVLVI